jgi:murein DD-endopeptidase MepM/ murein hydrolase activator NlpD
LQYVLTNLPPALHVERVDTRLLLAWLHLLALAAGPAGLWARARALRDSLRDPEDHGALRRAFVGNAWWSVAVVVWLVTGIWRLAGSTEKSTSYYFTNRAFYLKMALALVVAALEVWPVKTFFRWRMKRAAPDARDVGRIEVISYVQCALLIVIVAAAVNVARDYGVVYTKPAVVSSSSSVQPASELPPVEPTGTETVSNDDVTLLEHEIAMPLDGIDPATLHSNFNERRGGGTRQHEALDMMAPRRTPIRSAAKGRVLKLFTSVNGGLMVYAADSSERFILMYAHLDGYEPSLRDGQPLARGQLLGYVGSTGNAAANAPHLHFAIARSADVKRWSKGKPIDPLPVLQASTKLR